MPLESCLTSSLVWAFISFIIGGDEYDAEAEPDDNANDHSADEGYGNGNEKRLIMMMMKKRKKLAQTVLK